ncbi:3-dehydroquinate dehydratase II [hydrothermal vent metagenome]|uniref:3-dehydroquinate dehydratase n=1 Tax=hydrothermal vent metagenome TaxID=652676 RepID=A0A3B0UCP3_9ZZZZ
MHIAIINGPNLNLLGTREPDVYGAQTFEQYFETLKEKFPKVNFSYFQSNIEGELIGEIQKMDTECDGIILNAAAYTHTSVGLGDAISAINTPVVEVHISNIYAREEYRHHSYLTGKCKGVISGLGLKGYELAVNYLVTK